MKAQPLVPTDAATIRKLAVAAEADPRSVRKELEHPGSVRGLPGHRIRAVLREHVLDRPLELGDARDAG